jgi:hypothetical protein
MPRGGMYAPPDVTLATAYQVQYAPGSLRALVVHTEERAPEPAVRDVAPAADVASVAVAGLA